MPHIHEKIDFTVEVFVVHANKVLLRMHDKYGLWLGVGGHIELDENPLQAAIREVKEEVGLDVELIGAATKIQEADFRELLPPMFMNSHRISDTHQHVTFVYAATSRSGSVMQGKTEVSTSIRWFTAEELQDPAYGIKEHIKQYALAALRVAS